MTTTDSSQGCWTFWIDRGGTFTDVIGVDGEGAEHTLKLLSSSPSYEDAAVEAMRRMLSVEPGAVFPAAHVAAIKMGTTVATNALLERKGARTLFVTTQGFGDAVLIGDQSRPELFALKIVRPEPLYAGVVEAVERLAADGAVVTPLDEEALAGRLAMANAVGFTSVAIAFLHSDLNPAHELAAGEIARGAGFDDVTLSHEASPLPRFAPRAETAIADAYLTPVLRAYVRQVAEAVNGAPLWFMTSAGGLVRAETTPPKDPNDSNSRDFTVMVTPKFGPGDMKKVGAGFVADADATNCDFNKDGNIDFAIGNDEGICSSACALDKECTEYSNFLARRTFRLTVIDANKQIGTVQANASASSTFDPVAMRGVPIRSFSGTLHFFSGGSQFTIEARCSDDIVIDLAANPLGNDRLCASDADCASYNSEVATYACQQLPSGERACRSVPTENDRGFAPPPLACVFPRTGLDNNPE